MGDELLRARRAPVNGGEQACLHLPAVPRSAAMARAAVRAWCARRGALDRVEDVALAVTEAVANSVLFAYPDRPDGNIELRFREIVGDGFDVTVRDFGVGIDAPRTQDDHFGLRLIERVADSAEIIAARPGVAVRMRFRAGPPHTATG